MTTWDVSGFRVFFEELHGCPPFAWQERLCEYLLETGTWPDVIDAPTGSGKSSVIDVHVFAVAAMAAGACTVPRRLAITVDRRALADGHAEHAREIVDRLVDSRAPGTTDGVLRDVGDRLLSLRAWQNLPGLSGAPDERLDPVEVTLLRGGAPTTREWLDDPLACQVIAATPDMWGSRLLFGGYGSTRFAAPREAGLLAFDSVVVVDEAHLNRQLVVTARQVARLAADGEDLGVCPVQVVAMSATADLHGSEACTLGVDPADLDESSDGASATLVSRLTRPKPVTLAPTPYLPVTSQSLRNTAKVFAEHVMTMTEGCPGTVGCTVNTVKLAVAVAEELEGRTLQRDGERRPLRVESLVGRMRPYDVALLRERHRDLFEHGNDDARSVDVVVATQTIEVGLDLDFSGMVTELAPGSALTQRAGRVNRSGTRDAGPVVVVVPEGDLDVKSRTAPYQPSDLREALEWLRERADAPDGLASWSLHRRGGGCEPPAEQPRREVFHRPEAWNVREWARTSQDLYAVPQLDLWLHDDLGADLTIGVVVRQGLPASAESARRQVAETLPLEHEVFPARIRDVDALLYPDRDFFTREGQRFDDGTEKVLVVRSGEVLLLSELDATQGRRTLRPGDLVVVYEGIRAFRRGIVDPDEGKDTAPDVSESLTERERRGDEVARRRFVRIGAGTSAAKAVGFDRADVMRALRSACATGDASGEAVKAVVRELLLGREPSDSALLLSELVEADGTVVSSSSLAMLDEVDDTDVEDFWLVLSGRLALGEAEDVRQTTAVRGSVTLEQHQRNVGEAAERLARAAGLAPPLVASVRTAGLLHDEGKRDARFQRSLRRGAVWDPLTEAVLAKSGMRNQAFRRSARQRSGLPGRWRHEQLSAAMAWWRFADEDAAARDLVTRLAGTSHGHGRALFEHSATRSAASLVPPASDATDPVVAAARLLFDCGEWSEVIDRTDVRLGPWACAYLEALVRAADCVVSRRGS